MQSKSTENFNSIFPETYERDIPPGPVSETVIELARAIIQSPVVTGPIKIVAQVLVDRESPVKPLRLRAFSDAGNPPYVFDCGRCHERVKGDSNYCPNCGRRIAWK